MSSQYHLTSSQNNKKNYTVHMICTAFSLHLNVLLCNYKLGKSKQKICFFHCFWETVCSHLGEIKYSKEIKGFWSCSCRGVLFYFHSSSKEMSSVLVHQRRLDLPYTTFTLKPNSLVVTMTGKVTIYSTKNAFRRRKQTNTAKQKKIKGKITICSVCVCVCCLYMNLGPKNNKAVYMRQNTK